MVALQLTINRLFRSWMALECCILNNLAENQVDGGLLEMGDAVLSVVMTYKSKVWTGALCNGRWCWYPLDTGEYLKPANRAGIKRRLWMRIRPCRVLHLIMMIRYYVAQTYRSDTAMTSIEKCNEGNGLIVPCLNEKTICFGKASFYL